MKNFICAVAGVCFALAGHAQSVRVQDDKVMGCAEFGLIYRTAADLRDTGQSPQQTLGYLNSMVSSGAHGNALPQVKRIINNIYFEPNFANASGTALQNQMRSFCMNVDKPQFQPLK